MIELKDIKYSNLDGNFITLKNVSDSGNTYYPGGVGMLSYGIANHGIYQIDPTDKEQRQDPTKGFLVVEASAGKVRWIRDHEIGNTYAKSFLQEAPFTGDSGIDMIYAFVDHIQGTYNTYTWDTMLVTPEGATEDLIIDGKRNGTPNVSTQGIAGGFNVTLSE